MSLLGSLPHALGRTADVLAHPDYWERIRELALRHRAVDRVQTAHATLLPVVQLCLYFY